MVGSNLLKRKVGGNPLCSGNPEYLVFLSLSFKGNEVGEMDKKQMVKT